MLGQMAMNLLRKAQTVRSEDLVRSDSDGEILASTHCEVEACAQTSYGNGAHVSADNKSPGSSTCGEQILHGTKHVSELYFFIFDSAI